MHEPMADLSSLSPLHSLLLAINVVVGVFNLIPGFPLDGGRMLRAAIWGLTKNLHAATWWASAVGQAIGWGFVFVGVAIVFGAQVPLLAAASSRAFGSPSWVVPRLRRGAEPATPAGARGARGGERGDAPEPRRARRPSRPTSTPSSKIG